MHFRRTPWRRAAAVPRGGGVRAGPVRVGSARGPARGRPDGHLRRHGLRQRVGAAARPRRNRHLPPAGTLVRELPVSAVLGREIERLGITNAMDVLTTTRIFAVERASEGRVQIRPCQASCAKMVASLDAAAEFTRSECETS